MQLRGQDLGFPPIWNAHSKALLLGSYPSPKSFETQFYYGHPQNRFWRLLAHLAKTNTPISISEKTEFLYEHHLALWDVLAQCQIMGASDASISNPIPNNLLPLLENSDISAIFCNGNAAYRYYKRYCEPFTRVSATLLPSTSPANAAYSFEKLVTAWTPLQPFLQ